MQTSKGGFGAPESGAVIADSRFSDFHGPFFVVRCEESKGKKTYAPTLLFVCGCLLCF